ELVRWRMNTQITAQFKKPPIEITKTAVWGLELDKITSLHITRVTKSITAKAARNIHCKGLDVLVSFTG
ncbi:MAG: hypothetical protein VXY83_00435, partial [Pseudomonadota bacterium]|nr:hypothetical protein [Pseudomonadota bacterium]